MAKELYSEVLVMDGERPKKVPDPELTWVSPLVSAKSG